MSYPGMWSTTTQQLDKKLDDALIDYAMKIREITDAKNFDAWLNHNPEPKEIEDIVKTAVYYCLRSATDYIDKETMTDMTMQMLGVAQEIKKRKKK
jgi:hypothetical protein